MTLLGNAVVDPPGISPRVGADCRNPRYYPSSWTSAATKAFGHTREMTMAATDRFEIPSEIRSFAEKSVEQARQAFDGFISAAQHAVNAFEGQAETARKGAKDVTQMAMTFAEQNIANSFDLAQQLVRAKDVQEVMRLQSDFIKTQMQALTEQAKELGERTSEAARDATKPKP
jgi:phasin